MVPISYARHQFPAVIIRHAVWVYLRFTLSYRDTEDLLAERGLDVSYETVRRWVLKFGSAIARNLRRLRPTPSRQWHLDESAPRTRWQRCQGGAAQEMRVGRSEPAVRGRLQTASSCGSQELPW
jgi:putative transposase